MKKKRQSTIARSILMSQSYKSLFLCHYDLYKDIIMSLSFQYSKYCTTLEVKSSYCTVRRAVVKREYLTVVLFSKHVLNFP